GQRRPAAARWRRALRIGAHGVRGDAWQRGGGGRARGRRRAAAGRGAGRPHARGGAGGAGGSGARPTAALDDSPRAVPCAPDPLPAAVMNLHWTSAVEAAELIRDGTFSSVQLVEACLARVREIDGDVQAWAFLDPEHALAQARAADELRRSGAPMGPLHGIPVGIKDIIDTACSCCRGHSITSASSHGRSTTWPCSWSSSWASTGAIPT